MGTERHQILVFIPLAVYDETGTSEEQDEVELAVRSRPDGEYASTGTVRLGSVVIGFENVGVRCGRRCRGIVAVCKAEPL